MCSCLSFLSLFLSSQRSLRSSLFGRMLLRSGARAHLTDCKSIAFNVNNLEISVQTSRLTEMNAFFFHFIAFCHTASLMSSRRKFW